MREFESLHLRQTSVSMVACACFFIVKVGPLDNCCVPRTMETTGSCALSDEYLNVRSVYEAISETENECGIRLFKMNKIWFDK